MINDINGNIEVTSLNNLPIGSKGRVKYLTLEGNTRRRMLDLGIIQDTEIQALNESPSGDPIAYLIRGTVIAIRSEDSSRIFVETI